MSWITGLAGKAEDFLNKVDKSAATALHKEDNGKLNATNQIGLGPTPTTENYSPYLSQVSKPVATRPDTLSPKHADPNAMIYSASVPSNLHNMDQSRMSRSAKRATPTTTTTPSGTGSARESPVRTSRKDKDEELFEFLNSKDTVDSGVKIKATTPNGKSMLNGGHSRQSSVSSTTSSPTGSKTPEPLAPSISITNSDNTPSEKSVNGMSDNAGINGDSNHATEPSSGYISSQEDVPESDHLPSLDLENRLLKNEVTQLSQEMTSVIHRAKEAQDDLSRVKRQLEETAQRQLHSDQVVRELRSHESDLQEALHAKDSQLAILRVRLEEADKELDTANNRLSHLHSEKNRILKDHTSSTGVQSQALDSLKDKLRDSEYTIQREQDTLRKIQQEAMQQQSALENEKEQLSQELASVQRRTSDDKGKRSELTIQLKSVKSQADAVKVELQEYKDKATRILQSKDKLIASLKDGSGMSGQDSGISVAELEEMRQERDMFREEVHRSQMALENLRSEVAELELQLQQESDNAQDQISSLDEQLHGEKERRDDADLEIHKQKQELRYAHEELVKQKTAFQSCIQHRENEIERLRNQLTNKSMSTSSEAELENRLHALTESLIHKQTMLESLSTEKNSLMLQLERMERQYREAETTAQRVTSTTINMNNEDDELRNRLPTFMRESPLDSDVARRMKRAANSIDRFSMKLGVFLRRYPIARIFVICYMALLHLWVSVVLLTYNPEIHSMDYLPKPPHDAP